MSTIDITQVAGLQAVNAEGNVIGTLSINDLTELVADKIVQEVKNEAVSARSASVMSEASTLAATDEYEDQLALDTNPAYVRSMDSEGNPKRTATTSLATVVGELLKYKFITLDNPTWLDLAIQCKKLPPNEPCIFQTKGRINNEHGSTAGNFGIMSNRDNFWQTIVVLNTMSEIDIQTDGFSIIQKTKLLTWQYTEKDISE